MQVPTKTVALVGHPESGIRTLGEALGALDVDDLEWMCLPGVHMLGRNTPDEVMTYDYLLGRTDKGPRHYPDGILALVQASDLERQLYLTFQLIDLRLPTLLMLDGVPEAEAAGIRIDLDKLARQLGIPVLSLEANLHDTAKTVYAQMAARLMESVSEKMTHWRPSVGLADAYHHLDSQWIFKHLKLHEGARLVEGLRLIGVAKAEEEYAEHPAYSALQEHLKTARDLLEQKKENWTMAEVLQRHNWIGQTMTVATVRAPVQTTPPLSWWRKLLRKILP